MGERYQAYPEYKDSGVEWMNKIPSNWEKSRIKMVPKNTIMAIK